MTTQELNDKLNSLINDLMKQHQIHMKCYENMVNEIELNITLNIGKIDSFFVLQQIRDAMKRIKELDQKDAKIV